MSRNLNRAVEIMLVENDPTHATLIKNVFGEGRVMSRITHAEDGGKALDLLSAHTKGKPPYRPDLVLLALDLPIKNGIEVLSQMKQEPSTTGIPVVVLTTSMDDEDARRCYELHANCFIVKPDQPEQFTQTVRDISDMWLNIALFPVT